MVWSPFDRRPPARVVPAGFYDSPRLPAGVSYAFRSSPYQAYRPPYGLLTAHLWPDPPPPRGGLLDPFAGGDDIDAHAGHAPDAAIEPMPAHLRGITPGPEGGLIGMMIQEHWPEEAAAITQPTADAHARRGRQVDSLVRPASSREFSNAPLGQVPGGSPFVEAPMPEGKWAQQRLAQTDPVAQPDYTQVKYPQGPVAAPPPTQEKLQETRQLLEQYVKYFQGQGWDEPAEAFSRFLAGSGQKMDLSPSWLRRFDDVRTAERGVQEYFEEWLSGEQPSEDPQEWLDDDLKNLGDGQTLLKSSKWDKTFAANNPELAAVVGQSNLHGDGDFTFTRDGDRITFTGTVRHTLEDDFDWERNKITPVPNPDRDGWLPYILFRHNDAIELQDYARAKPFSIESVWAQRVTGTLLVRGDRRILESIHWSDLAAPR